jgi:hypothetical protein
MIISRLNSFALIDIICKHLSGELQYANVNLEGPTDWGCLFHWIAYSLEAWRHSRGCLFPAFHHFFISF